VFELSGSIESGVEKRWPDVLNNGPLAAERPAHPLEGVSQVTSAGIHHAANTTAPERLVGRLAADGEAGIAHDLAIVLEGAVVLRAH
jgi:hypothetical protein